MSERPLSREAKALIAMSRTSLSRRRILQVAGVGGVFHRSAFTYGYG